MLERIAQDLPRARLWAVSAIAAVPQIAFFSHVFRRAHAAGVLTSPLTSLDLFGYWFVFLLLNAAFVFAFIRPGLVGRRIALLVLLLAALVSIPASSTLPESAPEFLPWQISGLLLLLLSYGGLAFAAGRGVAVVATRFVRGRSAA